MAAQLVLAAMLRFQFNQAVARAFVTANRYRHFYPRQRPVMSDRRLRAFVFRGKLVGDFVQLFRQRIVDGRTLQHVTTHHRVIGFLHLMLFKLLR
ncbi:hypothetical protein D3C81_2005460 [compost metagenome]